MSVNLEVWEVYKRDSLECAIFLTEEQAKNQKIFEEVDYISKSVVFLSNEELSTLKQGFPIFIS